MIESDIDVIIKMIAEIVVALESTVAEPLGPNAVCDPIPPNAPARSAAFPLCRRTTITKKTQTITWIPVTKIPSTGSNYSKRDANPAPLAYSPSWSRMGFS